ncbi:hypothetical protein J3R82DRAFT_3521 [Butyriboletus roseoflavus]|nr:hypothetical protein J3R82DRAFT_3521 [Butyriboletus roseoflavus]
MAMRYLIPRPFVPRLVLHSHEVSHCQSTTCGCDVQSHSGFQRQHAPAIFAEYAPIGLGPHASSSTHSTQPPQRSHNPSITSLGLQQGSVGYGTQHMHYAAQRIPTTETISLEIIAVYESAGKWRNPRSNAIGSVREGLKDVDAQSTAQELVVLAFEAVVPQIKAYDPRFPWRNNEFIVRDKKWVNLTTYANMQPYFNNECLHPGRSKNSKGLIFKSE